MSESFYQTLFPGTCHVLGHALPPLSLWTLSVLQAVRSPFLSINAETEFTLSDLQIAVRCALTPTLQPPDLKPTLVDRWQHFLHSRSKRYLQEQATAFIAWLLVHQKIPGLWTRETDGDPRCISAPLELSQASALMALGMSHHEAWSCSPGYAFWLILAHDERGSDSIRFVDEDEDAEIEAELEEAEIRSEAEVLAQARADLPPAVFEKWLAARTSNPAKT